MKEVKTGKGTFVFVEVPGKIWQPETSVQGDGIPCLTYYSFENTDPTVICLPPGSFTFIGTTKDIDEEKAKQIVDWYTDSNDSSYDPQYNETTYFDVFKDYSPNDDDFDTATESFNSLLTSQGLDGSKCNYAILKKQE